MKVTINWLKDFVDINISPEELAEKLTNAGMEVEEIIYQNHYLKNVVVGKILKITKHPNADKIVVCSVDIGEKITQICTAATNVREGHLVPVSLEGANLANGIQIKKSVIRGEASDGMFCSGEELGIGDDYYKGASVNGILILQEDYKPGTKIEDALGLNDVILDVNVTSNRPDCMSIYGIAKEVSAVTGEKVHLPKVEYKCDSTRKINDFVNVDIKNTELCPRYMASALTDVKINESPLWLKHRLYAVDIKSINNIVDITNYVLIEYGQPMHAFDYYYLTGKKIIVRNAKEGEKLACLNGNTYDLKPNMLVVCDEEKPAVIAGIIGGVNSSVTENTKDVVFEAAAFERANIRVTSRTIGVRTDSTARFEKGVYPCNAELGMKKALSLVYELKCANIVDGIIDKNAVKIETKQLSFSLERIESILGVKIDNNSVLSILNNLGIPSEINGNTLKCTIPPDRADIENEHDIAEEIIRIYGYDVYDNIQQKPLKDANYTVGHIQPVIALQREFSNILKYSGYYETINLVFCPANSNNLIGDVNSLVKINNPISDGLGCLRTSLATSILNCLARNFSRNNKQMKLFEVGKRYLDNPEQKQIEEKNVLAFGVMDKSATFFDLKGVVEKLLVDFDVHYKMDYSKHTLMHPGISADLIDRKSNAVFCTFGKVNPKYLKNYDLPDDVYYAEIDMDFLLDIPRKTYNVKSLSKFPSVERDLAVVLDENVRCSDIIASIKRSAGNILENIELFDIYRSQNIGENKKSMAFSMTFSSTERTLTDTEINTTFDKILGDLGHKFGAKLR